MKVVPLLKCDFRKSFIPFAIFIFVADEIRKAIKRRLKRKNEKLNVG